MDKGHVIDVLDHGYVKFIDSMGSDESVIEAARMSTGRGFEGWTIETCAKCGLRRINGEEKTISCGIGTREAHEYKVTGGDASLLDFLWRKKHSTPFEMVELALEIQAPIMVFREWQRHRTQSYNEFSARYSQMPNLHYMPDASRLKKQSSNNKQGTGEEEFPQEYIDMTLEELEYEQKQTYSHYEQMLSEGVAKEIARLNTPVSRYSKMRAKANLRNWLGFLNLRLRPNAQFEIRVFAEPVADIIRKVFPKSYELFEEYDLYGVSFSRTEMAVIRDVIKTIEMSRREMMEPFITSAKKHKLEGRKLQEFIEKLEKGGLEILS